ncbi:MAG: TspO/MBR family protein [Patescibacteria group bacterium]
MRRVRAMQISKMGPREWIALGFFIALAEFAGVVGSAFTVPAVQGWYTTLVLPVLSPPFQIFGPVWTALFALMGVAGFLVWWRQSHASRRLALLVFGLQLALNALWATLFFGLQDPKLALIEIAALLLAIAWTMVRFYHISKTAAYLLVPYILWVAFATYLNYTIWMLNAG